eukprot:scpid18325/ scgid26454/ Nodal modulator 2; pM5 protein 2
MALAVLSTAILFTLCSMLSAVSAGDLVGCGGFIQSDISVNFSQVEVVLCTKDGVEKYRTDCAPNNGYFLIPLYDKGEFVLRVEPPNGWKFLPESVELNVDGETDACSRGEDLNFVFAGFALSGRVVSRGETKGPGGVDVSVTKDNSNDVISTVQTDPNGQYFFPGLLPGKYVISASHKVWKLEKSSTTVELKTENAAVSDDFVVSGYDVHGFVENEGKPTSGVSLLLFGSPSVPVVCPTVDKPKLDGDSIPGELLCEAKSGQDGRFHFDSLPLGEYHIRPYYRSEHITFDVLPRKLSFTVGHDSLELKEAFRVHGFTVFGRVLNKQGGSGLKGATVSAKGLSRPAVTDSKGQYFLEHVRAGVYQLTIEAEGYFFKSEDVTVSASAPQLRDIAASEFSLCGKVSLATSTKSPTPISSRQIRLSAPDQQGKEQTATCDKEGKFCFQVPAGKWQLAYVATAADKKAGFLLHPVSYPVEIVDSPRLDVVFSQFFATVTAEIVCMSSPCTDLPVALQSLTRQDSKRTVLNAQQIDEDSLIARVAFKNILPGQYKLSILYDKWCWKETSFDIMVGSEDVQPTVFKQIGHLLKCLASHSLTLKYQLTDDADYTNGNGNESDSVPSVQGQSSLVEGSSQVCLPRAGIYQLTTESCHKFTGEPFTYSTAVPGVVSLTASAHRVSGSIILAERSAGMHVSVVKQSPGKEAEKPVIVGPLESTSAKAQDGSPQFIYHYTHWARSDEVLVITPQLEDVLFDPPSQSVTVPRISCPDRVPAFRGRRGVYIAGKVTPAVAGVKILLKFKSDAENVDLLTDTKGQYRYGPIDSDRKYSVSAFLDGYVIESAADSTTDFMLSKLGEINIAVLSKGDKSPVSGVLVSLSGGKFRSNNFTNDKGQLRILNLAPGQYYLRSMLKEYSFDPASKLIDVSEGGTVNVDISAHRVAFSCFGITRSLGGMTESSISVNAQGLGKCSSSRESAVSGDDGMFRLRGLLPDCQYEVAVGDNGSGGLLRAIPATRTVSVSSADVRGADIVVFRPQSQLELSGYIKANRSEHLSTLKVMLFAEPHLTSSPVQIVSVGNQPFFHFAALPSASAPVVYRYVVESSLSRSTFSGLQAEVRFTVLPGELHRHFTLEFSPLAVNMETESSLKHGSLLGVLCVLLLTICVLNQQRLISMATAVIYSYLSNSGDSSASRSGRRR